MRVSLSAIERDVVRNRSGPYIVCFAGIHVVIMLKFVVAAHDCGIFRPDDVFHALHELAEDFETGFRRQDKRSCSVLSVRSDRLTKSHWADAFDGYRLVELHDDQVVVLKEMESLQIMERRMLDELNRSWSVACMLLTSRAFIVWIDSRGRTSPI